MSGDGPDGSLDWPSGVDVPVAEFAATVAVLIARLGLDVEEWEEDGLGASVGAWLFLPGGTRVLMLERTAAIPGCTAIWMDAAEASNSDPEAILEGVLRVTGLSITEVRWRPENMVAWRDAARSLVADADLHT